MIDWERVRELHSEIGDDGFAEVVELFLDEVEAVVLMLGTRPDKLEEDLHFLKGSALNLGFRDFGWHCQQGEKRAAAGEGAQVDLPDIRASYDRSKVEFLGHIGEVTAAA